MRYGALIEYDGSAYYGFQKQNNGPTVQEELERAIGSVSGKVVAVLAAGRTDSGVHALGQVIAFDLAWNHGSRDLLQAMNAKLPDDIAVLGLSEKQADFHPRFDAKRRTYQYHIYNQSIRSPIRRSMSWHVNQPLDIDNMNEAAERIIGQHDFATFGQAPSGRNTVRQVFKAKWQAQDGLLKFTIEADAFLFRMVRSLVGSMKVVGEGSWSVEEFRDALKAKERGRSAKTAPPQGLFLTTVSYR
jgi:tRNA pseudouridine38-40 synthase